MTVNLLENGEMVLAVQQNLQHGGRDLNTLPAMLCRLLDGGGWRKRLVPQTREVKTYQDDEFERFVADAPPEGLGTDAQTLVKLCGVAGTPEGERAVTLIDQATQRKRGRRRVNGNNIPILHRPEGTTKQKAARRLRKQRPDLLGRVEAGELSHNAAMIEAGFRRKTLTVPREPKLAAAALLRHFDKDELAELLRLIAHARA